MLDWMWRDPLVDGDWPELRETLAAMHVPACVEKQLQMVRPCCQRARGGATGITLHRSGLSAWWVTEIKRALRS